MIEGIYYFGDQLRWNLGWPNPNAGGAFVAMLWAFCFGFGSLVFKKRFLKVLFLLLETGLLFLVCKSYSRGALLAVGAGLILMCLLCLRGESLKSVCRDLGVRAALLAVLLIGTGFIGRVSPDYVQQDASVLNRSVLWKGGLEMISHFPLQGWGKGNSGEMYMQWFQSLDATARTAGMVNSYLHVGVERGLPFLGVFLFLALFPLSLAWQLSRPSCRPAARAWGILGAGVLCVFLAANVFSTLWIFSGLWLPLLVAWGCVGWGCCGELNRAQLVRSVGWSLTGSFAICLMLFGSGIGLSSRRSPAMQFNGGQVRISTAKADEPILVILPDREVLGEDWGKELRRLAFELNKPVVAPLHEDSDLSVMEGAYHLLTSSLSGVGASGLLQHADEVLVLHPVGVPPEELYFTPSGVTVILPELDMSGVDGLWRRKAIQQGWRVVSSGAFSRDIRSEWPGILHFVRFD